MAQERSHFDGLSEELVLMIARNLYQPDDDPKPEWLISRGRYNDVRNFCLVNKKCRRIGQEVMFAHCDLTARYAASPLLLTRTLLENPTLASKVQDIKISATYPENGLFHPVTPPDRICVQNGWLMRDDLSDICDLMLRYINRTVIDRYTKNVWKQRLDQNFDTRHHSIALWMAFCVLLTVASKVRRLHWITNGLRSLDHSDTRARCPTGCIDCIQEFIMLPEFSALQTLEFVLLGVKRLDFGDGGTTLLKRHSWLLALPNTAELHVDAEGDYKSSDGNWAPTASDLAVVRHINFRNNDIGDLFVDTLLRRCPTLRSLTYTVVEDTDVKILDFSPSVGQSLENLEVIYEGLDSVWPRNLYQCSSLKSVKVTGDYISDQEVLRLVLDPNTPSEYSLPPNIEIFILTITDLDQEHASIYKGSDYHEFVFTAFERFLPIAKIYWPRLKHVTVGGDSPWVFDEAFLDRVQGAVVYLVSKKEWEKAEGLRKKTEAEADKEVFDLRKWDLDGKSI